jgi:hypothetical protein
VQGIAEVWWGAMQQASKEKARRSRASDEYISRPVYFASFAI